MFSSLVYVKGSEKFCKYKTGVVVAPGPYVMYTVYCVQYT